MISRPRITCFSRVACSILRATTSTSSAASSRASAPRGFLSPLSNSTGALSVNVMDGILGDVNNAITEWFLFLSLTQRVRSQAPREDPRLSLLLPTQRADEGNLAAAPGVRVRRPRQVRRRSAPGNLPAARGDLQRGLSVDAERTFRWSFVRGFVTLEMTLGERRIALQMLPLQAVVLLLFQRDERIAWGEVSKRVIVPDALLRQVIASLLFSKFQVLDGR